MDKSIEISLRLADEAMTKAKKLEERITELENLNDELQLKISELENQKTERATEKGTNTDDLLKKIEEKERTITELEQALEKERNNAVEFQEKQKKMEEEMKELEVAIAKGNESVHELIKEHQLKMGEMFESLTDRNRAITEELTRELDAKDRKIMELENELQAEKDKTRAATTKEKEQLGMFGSKSVSFGDEIGVKKMGVIDSAVFEAEARKRSSRVGRTKAKESLKYWEKLVQDPNWNPFTIIVKDGKCVETLDKTNEDLRHLKMSSDREVYKAIKVALEEMKEHNRKGRYPVLEFWNFSKNRKATLDEGLEYLSGNSNKRMRM